MAESPRYENSVKLDLSPSVDVNSSAQMLINSFRQFSNSVSDFAEQVTKHETIERQGIVKHNISATYQGFAQQALIRPNQQEALNDYNQKSAQYAQELLGSSYGKNRRWTENLLTYYYTKHRTPIVNNIVEQAKRSQQVDDVERNERATNDIVNAIQNSNPALGDNQFDSAHSLMAMQKKSLENQMIQGRMGRDVFAHAVHTMNKKYQSLIMLRKFEIAQEDGKGAEFLKSLSKTHIDGFSPADYHNLHSQILQANTDKMHEAGLADGQLNRQMKDEYSRIEETGSLENAELTNNVNQYIPERAQQFEIQKRIAARLYNIKQATAQMSPSQVNDYLESLKPKEGENQDYPHAVYQEIYDRAVTAVKKQRSEIMHDPMAFTQKQSFISQSARDYQLSQQVGAVGQHQNNSPINMPIEPPFKSAIQYQQSIGLSLTGKGNQSIRLMTNADANNRVIQIEQSNPRQKIQYMNKLNAEFGGGLPYQLAIKQLVNAGMPAQYALLANINPESQDAQEVAAAFSIPVKTLAADLKAKEPDDFKVLNNTISTQVYSGSGGSQKFQSYVDSANSYAGDKSIQYLDGLKGTLQQLTYYRLLSGKNVTQDQALDWAQNVIADRYNYTNINNQTVRVPKKYTPDAIKTFALNNQDRVKDFPFVLNSQDPQGAKELVMKGHWANDPVDNGLVWVDFNGVVWKDKDHQPLAFSFDDAQYGPFLHEMMDLDRLNQIQALKRQEETALPQGSK